eukprot:1179462-Prorocentrum_minimum.AAC.2
MSGVLSASLPLLAQEDPVSTIWRVSEGRARSEDVLGRSPLAGSSSMCTVSSFGRSTTARAPSGAFVMSRHGPAKILQRQRGSPPPMLSTPPYSHPLPLPPSLPYAALTPPSPMLSPPQYSHPLSLPSLPYAALTPPFPMLSPPPYSHPLPVPPSLPYATLTPPPMLSPPHY